MALVNTTKQKFVLPISSIERKTMLRLLDTALNVLEQKKLFLDLVLSIEETKTPKRRCYDAEEVNSNAAQAIYTWSRKCNEYLGTDITSKLKVATTTSGESFTHYNTLKFSEEMRTLEKGGFTMEELNKPITKANLSDNDLVSEFNTYFSDCEITENVHEINESLFAQKKIFY